MMLWQRLAIRAFTVLAATSGILLAAQEEKKTGGKGADRLDALARQLDLSDKQKQQVKQIYADFDRKAAPLIRQLCAERDKQWQALQKVLDKRQREKLKEVVKAQGAKELQDIVEKLKLSEKQKGQVEKIRGEFWKKFLALSTEKDESIARQYRELHTETVAAAHKVLTPEQCARLHGIQKQDFDEWHDFIFRHDHLKALNEKLGLSAAQQKQIQELCASHEKKLAPARARLKELCKQGCADLRKVLTAEQRARLHEVFPFNFHEMEEPPGGKKKKE